MKMKKAMVTALVFAMLMGATATVNADEEKVVIGVAAYAMDEYGKAWADAFEEYAESVNAEVIMTSADTNIDKQLSDIDSLIAQKPDIMIIRPVDADGLVAGVNACEKAGIPTIISSYTVNCENYAAWIGADQRDNGILQVQFMEEYLEKNPETELKIGYIWGTMGLSGCQERYDPVAEWADSSDRAEIVSENVANWSVNDAMSVMEDWLQGMPEINTIICQNDEMATGVANTLRAAGKDMDDYLVIGIDGSANGLQYVKDGLLDATIGTDPVSETQQNVDLALRVADGETFDEPVYLDSYVLVTEENVDEF